MTDTPRTAVDVDDTLLAAAAAVLGTSGAEETVRVALELAASRGRWVPERPEAPRRPTPDVPLPGTPPTPPFPPDPGTPYPGLPRPPRRPPNLPPEIR